MSSITVAEKERRSVPTEIVYLFDQPVGEHNVRRFGIEILTQSGFEVEAWDFTAFLYPALCSDKDGGRSAVGPVFRQFLDRQQAIDALVRLPRSTLVISVLSWLPESLPLYRALSRSGARWAVSVANALPPLEGGELSYPGGGHLLSRLRRLTYRQARRAMVKRLPFGALGVRPPDLLLAGGRLSPGSGVLPLNKRSEVLWLHALDYDCYLEEKAKGYASDQRSGVFLDEYLPFHPDYLHYQGVSAPAVAEEYYPSLCRFFDTVEAQYGARITVAAHPRSRYEAHPDFFNGRLVLRGSTAALVAQCGFVIAHCSTSLNLAVLFRRPMLFVTSERLQRTEEGRRIAMMASIFGKRPISLDDTANVNWVAEFAVDERAYDHYRNDYIKRDGTPERPTWQAFADYLQGAETLSLSQRVANP